jgi:hypothetical protein
LARAKELLLSEKFVFEIGGATRHDAFVTSCSDRGGCPVTVGDPLRDFWSKGLPFLTLAVAPFFAGLLALFYRRSSYLFMDHLVFAVHVNSFALLTSLIPAVLLFVWPSAAELDLEVAIALGYVVIACHTFYGSNWGASMLKGVTLGVLDLALFLMAALVVLAVVFVYV